MNSDEILKAPFPYFGGKSSVSHIVWEKLGNADHYIEPFFGSGAVLLGRPNYSQNKYTETVNDKDGHIANVWRSIQFSPDEVAKWCDWPVNHADLIARKAAMIKNEGKLLENLAKDDKWHDPVMAGYWIWAASCWIGSGLTRPGQIPHIGDAGMGVHAKGQRPHIGDAGMGVHAKGQRPHVGNAGMGEPYNPNIYRTMRLLSERLRYVRVVCGDWTRVCGGSWQTGMGVCGMFFDPPYAVEDRDKNIYHNDSITVGKDVEKWCLSRGNDPKMRIVVAGYKEEYKNLVDAGWKTQSWSAQGGYSNLADSSSDAIGKTNRHRETLFFSPHCVKTELF